MFIQNFAGSLGGLTNANAVEYITNTREVMNLNLAHDSGRNLILTPTAETKILQNATFHQADRLGDEGTALREASLGRKFGFDTWMGQNMRSVAGDATLGSAAIDNGAGYPVGTTVMTIDGAAMGELVAGQWISIGGLPYHVVAVNADPATSITLEYGLRSPVANDAPIAIYNGGTVNNGPGYPAGYSKSITVTGFSGSAPRVGRFVTFGATTTRYTIISTNGSTTIELDRPLEAALTNGQAVRLGPTGDFNLAFHRNAMTLAIRPLAQPRQGTGALSAVANYNNLSIRVVITYDGTKQGHLVTLDFLAGIKVLDTDLGAVMLS
jgi:hypothetical protein